MINRKQKIKELVENFQKLKRTMAFHAPRTMHEARITPSQWGALMIIEQQGESTVKYISKALGITSSASTQLIDGLVANHYVARQPSESDKRTIILTLSKKTKSQVTKMKKSGLKKFLKFFEVLSDKEFNQYIQLNKKIVDRLLNKKIKKNEKN